MDKEGITDTDYSTEGYGNFHVENIIVWAHLKGGNMRVEQSEGCDYGVLRAEDLQDSIFCRVHKQ